MDIIRFFFARTLEKKECHNSKGTFFQLKIAIRDLFFLTPTVPLTFSLEVALEERGLVLLHLPVLDGRPSQRVVQLHRLDGRSPGLVLGGLRAQPEVRVPGEAPGGAAGVRLERGMGFSFSFQELSCRNIKAHERAEAIREGFVSVVVTKFPPPPSWYSGFANVVYV